jgi:hypothetical protein
MIFRSETAWIFFTGFDNQAAAKQFLKVAMEANLGLSINMSASIEGAKECCKFAGIVRHSIGYSLGFEGATDKLPNGQLLKLTTMCGHGMLSINFAQKMMSFVKENRRTPQEAGIITLIEPLLKLSDRFVLAVELDDPATEVFGRQCLVARRLVERGVRFVELLPQNLGHDRWDQHSKLREGHADNARATDKPIAGLLKDLKSRGLLDETLVLWGGEFGRTPTAQGANQKAWGRDHQASGFTMWMAGGGIKGGTVYGATDELGFMAVENPVSVADFHATVLHQLGFDFKQLYVEEQFFPGKGMVQIEYNGVVLDL